MILLPLSLVLTDSAHLLQGSALYKGSICGLEYLCNAQMCEVDHGGQPQGSGEQGTLIVCALSLCSPLVTAEWQFQWLMFDTLQNCLFLGLKMTLKA